MNKKFLVKSFPTMISEELEVPNLGELLNMQFTHLCHIDDFYKYGCEYQRYLIDKLPLLGKTKNIGVTFHVQYLFPGTAPLHNRTGYVREWHVDYDITINEEDNPYRSHLLLSECECMTEFNDNEFIVDLEKENIKKTGEFNIFLNKNEHLLKPKKMTPNRIHTFDSHVHRIVLPTKPQLRFMFRVVESNSAPIRRWNEAAISYGSVGKGNENIHTIIKEQKKIILDHSLMDENYYK